MGSASSRPGSSSDSHKSLTSTNPSKTSSSASSISSRASAHDKALSGTFDPGPQHKRAKIAASRAEEAQTMSPVPRSPIRWPPGQEVIDLDSDAELDDSHAREIIDLDFDIDIDAITPNNNGILGEIHQGNHVSKDAIVLGGSDFRGPYPPAKLRARQPLVIDQQPVQYGEDLPNDFLLGQNRLGALRMDDNYDLVGFAPSGVAENDRALRAVLAIEDLIQIEDDANMSMQAARVLVPAEPAEQQDDDLPEAQLKVACIDTVAAVFPGICLNHIEEIYQSISQDSEQVIAHILDKEEQGEPWPKARATQRLLKRKRELNEEEEAIRKYDTDRELADPMQDMKVLIKDCLQEDFISIPMVFLESVLKQNNYGLFPAYRVLEKAERTWNSKCPPYIKLKKDRKVRHAYLDKNDPQSLDAYLLKDNLEIRTRDVLLEFQAARKFRRKQDREHEAERQAEAAEEQNLLDAQREGLMSECGCCFCDSPINRMVYCNKDEGHMFCRDCARQMAETEIGNSKYELRCMSMDGCDGGFSISQRKLFLSEKSTIALERNEQEAALRMAGIENLASCPFCPYAAEYPPVEVNHEFACAAPDCEKVSCRLCKLESHIPMTCAEYAKENGLSMRRQIEEAMSAALIRRCNKCNTPFVKENGCNKMTCTRAGCFNTQCYICSKPAGYNHFNDTTRGGKNGNCPLFDTQDLLLEQRHENEVRKAEREALAKVRADHPQYAENDLKINMSDKVAEDDKRRAENNTGPRFLANFVAVEGANLRQAPIRLAGFGDIPQAIADLGDRARLLREATEAARREAAVMRQRAEVIRQEAAAIRQRNAAARQGQALRMYDLAAAVAPPQLEPLQERGHGPLYEMDELRDMPFMLRLGAGGQRYPPGQDHLQGNWY